MNTLQASETKVVEQHIEEYAANHTRKETLLYNNRCFFMHIRPSQSVIDQYGANRTWILNNFKIV